MTQRLQGAVVQIEWQLALQDVPAVDSQARLQLLRILQEALTNALRHSGGTQIAVYAAFEPSTRQLQLSVTDDGRWVTAAPTRGRGLANMRHRAAHLGAQLEVETRPDGTRVHLLWSVPQDSPPVR
jgi:signal transduction histidine kinase